MPPQQSRNAGFVYVVTSVCISRYDGCRPEQSESETESAVLTTPNSFWGGVWSDLVRTTSSTSAAQRRSHCTPTEQPVEDTVANATEGPTVPNMSQLSQATKLPWLSSHAEVDISAPEHAIRVLSTFIGY